MKTLYLTQCSSSLPVFYNWMEDYILLSYKERTDQTHIFCPDTTWTEGRNLLRQFIINDKRLCDYDYYCFIDEDILPYNSNMDISTFWHDLEEEIYKNKFRIATPKHWGYSKGRFIIDDLESKNHIIDSDLYFYQVVDFYDAACNYFCNEVFMDSRLFDYDSTYDSRSWYASQFIHILKSNHFFRDSAVQLNMFKVKNTQNSNYPRENWKRLFLEIYLKDFKDFKNYKLNDVRGFL